ncbi:hypothetical protein [Nocardioides sp. SYSU DS0651]|uniref:hypothetical protein n=1 Tax=Nocardioides sp. SYSU DS0651 TaxID=3415955 RepID=UPI003F4C9299
MSTSGNPVRSARRISTETKASYKTSELPIFLVVLLGILIASAVADGSDFGAQEAWRYITWLTIGYLISRGLAKLGSREYFDDDADEARGHQGGTHTTPAAGSHTV